MPYKISDLPSTTAPDSSGAVVVTRSSGHQLDLWPYQSLPPTGFVWFIGLTSALISLPLIALLGTPVLWGLLPFLGLAIAGMWWALQRNHRDSNIVEHLTIVSDRMTLVRKGPRGRHAEWQANPYWVTPILHAKGGPVVNYLTLRGGPREVELGAFLSEPERVALHGEVASLLRHLR